MTILKYFSYSIRGIIHVGAHRAQELEEYVDAGIHHVLWIEANPHLASFLSNRIKQYNQSMVVGCFAASDVFNPDGILKIASNEQSSSLLEFGAHSVYHPDISYVNSEPVVERRIDDWMHMMGFCRSLYNTVNLDVQGFELKVLGGMIKQLPHIELVECEVNFEHTYQGSPLVTDVDRFLKVAGFWRVFTSRWGPCYGTGLYIRTRKIPSFLLQASWVFLSKKLSSAKIKFK
jgi:FkbM family methyltransferase